MKDNNFWFQAINRIFHDPKIIFDNKIAFNQIIKEKRCCSSQEFSGIVSYGVKQCFQH